LGLDWQRASLSAYLEALEAHHDAHDLNGRKGGPVEVSDDLKRFMKAHGLAGKPPESGG